MNILLKRTSYLILAGVLGTSTLIGCGKKAEVAKESNKLSEISVMIFDRANVPEGEGTLTNNRWTKYINEEMAKQGVKVNFVSVPRSEESQKIPVMMASKTAADIMFAYNRTLVEQWYKDGGTIELSDLINKYGKDLKNYVTEDVLKLCKTAEGKQFAIAARRSVTQANNAFIRKDWLDKLGMKIPTTPDELYTALKAFKEKDPGNVGKGKVVAYGGSVGNDGNLLGLAFTNIKDEKSYYMDTIKLPSVNTVGHAYRNPGYKEFLIFKNKLYNEGLTDPEYFTSQNAQKEKEAFVSGTLGYWETDVMANVDILRGGLLQNLRKKVPDADMVSMPPLKNINDGKQYNIAYNPGGGLIFIPKTAKDPVACMKYLNFIAGKGGETVYFGKEGTNYSVKDGVKLPIDSKLNAKQLDWIKGDLLLVGNNGYFKKQEEAIKTIASMNPAYSDYILKDYADAGAGIKLEVQNYVSPIEAKQGVNLDKVFVDYRVKLTTCKPSEFESIYKKFKVELEKYQIKEILAERAEYYNKQK